MNLKGMRNLRYRECLIGKDKDPEEDEQLKYLGSIVSRIENRITLSNKR